MLFRSVSQSRYMVLHHTVGINIGKLKQDRQYHAIIYQDGRWYQILPWQASGAATAGTNSRTINIALVGRFDPPHKLPSNKQLATLVSVVRKVRQLYPLPVVSHGWIGRNLKPYYVTACCGSDAIVDYVKARL